MISRRYYPGRRLRRAALIAVCLLVTLSVASYYRAASLAVQSGSPGLVISQVYGGGGNSGATLRNDFIELFNRGTSPVSLAGWSVQYNSAGGTGVWAATPLSGEIAPGGYYLIQQAAGTGGVEDLPAPDASGNIAMSATNGKVALVSSATALNGACPLGPGVVDLVGYGTANCSEGGQTAPGLGNTTAALRARGGCTDTNNNRADFAERAPSLRNSASPAKDCSSVLALDIHTIQGGGAASPYVGRDVHSSGIVTARKTNGFFLQAPDADVDEDPNTSEGIFVFTSVSPTVTVGDSVTAVGSVDEFFGLTQITAALADVTVSSGQNPLPTPLTLTGSVLRADGPPDQLERFEGMRLRAGSLTTVSPSDGFGEFFVVLSGVPRPFREPGIDVSDPLPPGSPCCVPRFDENAERLLIDSDGQPGQTQLVVTTGVTLTEVSGPLEFGFGNYRLLPDAPPATITPNRVASPVPAPGGGEFTIGSFNLENFFIGNSNFAVKRDKAALAIRNVMRLPDILGVEEVVDLATLTALAEKINADVVAAGGPSPNYRPFLEEGADAFPDDIDSGFLVKTSRVTVVGVTQEGKGVLFTDPTDGSQDLLFERPPLILRATIPSPTGSAFPVTVVVNHMQSLIDIDDPARGGRQRLKRRLQAEFTAHLAQGLQQENLVLVGDFNAFQFNDGFVDVIGTIGGAPAPADQVVLASPDLVNPDLKVLVRDVDANILPSDQRYSFIFQGNAQTLDHVLVDGEMWARLSRFAYARNDADFPEAYRGDSSRPERISDHDMPVAYFSFPPPAADISITQADSPDPALTGATLTYAITVTNAGPDVATDVVVTDRLPARTTFASCAATGGGVCGGSGNDRTVSFASLGVGATETITLTATVDNLVFSGTMLSNTASVTSGTTDPGLGNNSAVATTAVNRALRVTPVVECVTRSGGGAFTVRFGYDNPNPVAITIPVGLGNFLAPLPIDRGQPTTFLPGRQQNVFTAAGRYGILVWTLDGRAAIGLINNPNQCPQ